MKVGVLTIFMAFLLAAGIPFGAFAGTVPDTDSDTVPDNVDNCMMVPNAPPLDCDVDQDGYGNICDADFDNGGAVGATDFPIFTANWAQPAPNVADLDCGGAVGATDFPLFTGAWAQPPGPSGLSCAGTIPCP